jgi:hypothetical protein
MWLTVFEPGNKTTMSGNDSNMTLRRRDSADFPYNNHGAGTM